jgi:hypothetical protein
MIKYRGTVVTVLENSFLSILAGRLQGFVVLPESQNEFSKGLHLAKKKEKSICANEGEISQSVHFETF